jgi:hypothetical protein
MTTPRPAIILNGVTLQIESSQVKGRQVMARKQQTIGVIFGGRSVEHDVSIVTAQQIMKSSRFIFHGMANGTRATRCATSNALKMTRSSHMMTCKM